MNYNEDMQIPVMLPIKHFIAIHDTVREDLEYIVDDQPYDSEEENKEAEDNCREILTELDKVFASYGIEV